MFEQNEFVAAPSDSAYAPVQPQAAAQASGLRGTLHDGHFIPPKAVVPEPQDMSGYGMAGYAPAQSGYNLRPPTPGAGQQAAAVKKTPSLFERITSGVRQAARSMDMDDDIGADDGSQQAATGTGGGGFHNSLRAAPRVAENPAQGQLNIDAPSAERKQAEGDLDIPAFLRRQAN